MPDQNAYRYLRTGLNLTRGNVLAEPNDMIDFISENLARIVTREIAQVVRRKIARVEARRGPLTRKERKILAREVLVKRVAGVTRKVHSELS